MDDYVIMPKADYKGMCDKVRAQTGSTELLKSGELLLALDDVIGSGDLPQLIAPSLSRTGSTLTITNPTSNGGFVETYNIYEGENLISSQASKTLDISEFDIGEHILYATVSGNKFTDSEKSNEVNASRYAVTLNLENVTATTEVTSVWHGDSLTVIITANDGYSLPNVVTATVDGVEAEVSYSNETGAITLDSVEGILVISASGVSPSLATDSWETIAQRANDGTYASYYVVGEEKDVELSNGETITMVLVGINHDAYEDGTTIPLSFVSKDLLQTSVAYGSAYTTIEFTNSSNLVNKLLNNITTGIYTYLPDGIKTNIKKPYKKVPATSGVANASFYSDRSLWIPTGVEVGHTLVSGSIYSGGTVYEYFSGDDAESLRIKYKRGEDVPTAWWTTDVYKSSLGGYSVIIKDDGSRTGVKTETENGVCFGFCL